MDRRYVVAALLVIVVAAAVTYRTAQQPHRPVSGENTNATIVADNLDIPWGIAFLPDGDLLVTERPGTLLRIDRSHGTTATYQVSGVVHRGEGGLLGVALHPSYTSNSYIYLYMTTRKGDMLQNRVVRYTLHNTSLSNPETIISGLPGAIYHDGGRIAFGPSGYLYITAGDATHRQWAQQRDILAGKILRLHPNGSIPSSNPFNNPVYSYGHRNPQGLAWIDGQLWATEHGDSQHDELNRIVKGGNYGWPIIEAAEKQQGMRQPEIYAQGTTWAPAGAAAINNTIFFAGLRGQTLYEATIQNKTVVQLDKHLQGQYGRLRAVAEGPEGDLYISTSNTDGRGQPLPQDDRIIRIDPDQFLTDQ
ncbi:MAG: PQQ-dependent sugar dehydrogenase [Candidatus Nanohaloarchaea archaeon]|nr:PQQ-dependent sugar dehydrogenase [Candidatus Nanohaloarchaea archaeon]